MLWEQLNGIISGHKKGHDEFIMAFQNFLPQNITAQ